MYYEIYVDSLFLVNFVMNLYVLLLVNGSVYRTATRLRLIAGAAVGAFVYLIPFFLEGNVGLNTTACMMLGTCLMIFTAFSIHSMKTFWLLLERLIIMSFVIGGGMVVLVKRIPFIGHNMQSIFGVMGVGAIISLLIAHFQERKFKKIPICRITLTGKDGKMKIAALIDSGNSLVEPISGKPVSVVDRTVFQGLWKEPPELYRVIPYHTIGKKRGMLKGYLIPEIQIELDDGVKICKDVYIAVSEESITGEGVSKPVKMIVNPVLLRG